MNKQFMLKTTLPVLAGLAIGLAAPGSALAQDSGAEVWARSCGRCHRIQPPTKYDARHWEAIVGHMALTARLTTDEEDAVRGFLMGAARRVALQRPEDGPREVAQLASLQLAFLHDVLGLESDEIFKRQCVACHGESGKGDGPAAIAFNPKPADLTDPNTLADLTDEDLLKSLTDGKGLMPAFSALLEPDELKSMVAYVRSLSQDR